VTALSVVIPNYNGARVLPSCLRALAAQDTPPAEVVVVDDGSSDGSADRAAVDYPGARVLRLQRNGGFAGAANAGVRAAAGPIVAVLNSDARPRPYWVHAVSAFHRSDCFSWGGPLLRPDGFIESAGDIWYPQGHTGKWLAGAIAANVPGEPYEVFAPPGAAVVFDRGLFLELGGYDERFGLYLEDIDLAFRAHRRGLRSWLVPTAPVEHDLAASSSPARATWYIARNSLWCHVMNSPDLRVRDFLNTTLREYRAASLRNVGAPYLMGRAAAIAGLRRSLVERRRRQYPPASVSDMRRYLGPPAAS
jgi:GT2 family glycosyltransferase